MDLPARYFGKSPLMTIEIHQHPSSGKWRRTLKKGNQEKSIIVTMKIGKQSETVCQGKHPHLHHENQEKSKTVYQDKLRYRHHEDQEKKSETVYQGKREIMQTFLHY